MIDPDTPVGVNFSGGTSSLWLIWAMKMGLIPRPRHVAVFTADTRDEHAWTYDVIDETEELCKREGILFVRCASDEPLFDSVAAATRGERTRIDNPPFWTENPGGGRGQLRQKCTQQHKTRPIRRAQSAWLESIGQPKRIRSYIGFAHDEQHRANKAVSRNDVQWSQPDFPAIRLGRPRAQQRAELERWTGKKAPPFSMCRRCPYKTPARWLQTPKVDQEIAFGTDYAIRDGMANVGVDEPAFLTDRLIPLERLVKKGDPQPNLPGFESSCDTGYCFL
jgi:hypothetical protein